MQEVFRAIGRLSRSSISVLINGESGTGKELVAHALHRHSPRANKPFIALNMAAIPKDLIEFSGIQKNIVVTSVITTRSVDELGLVVGSDVVALVKSTEVSIAKL